MSAGLRPSVPHQALLARLYPQRDPRHLEAWIRASHGPLYRLEGPRELIVEARIAALCSGACPQLAEALACAYGL